MKKIIYMLTMLTACFLLTTIVFADEKYVDGPSNESLNVRSEPNMDGDVESFVFGGDKINIEDEIEDEDGNLWYEIEYDGKTGYVSAAYIIDEYDASLYEKSEPEEIETEANENTATANTTAGTTAAETTTAATTTAVSSDITEATTVASMDELLGESSTITAETSTDSVVDESNANNAFFIRTFGDFACPAFLITTIIVIGGLVSIDIGLIKAQQNGGLRSIFSYDPEDDLCDDDDDDDGDGDGDGDDDNGSNRKQIISEDK